MKFVALVIISYGLLFLIYKFLRILFLRKWPKDKHVSIVISDDEFFVYCGKQLVFKDKGYVHIICKNRNEIVAFGNVDTSEIYNAVVKKRLVGDYKDVLSLIKNKSIWKGFFYWYSTLLTQKIKVSSLAIPTININLDISNSELKKDILTTIKQVRNNMHFQVVFNQE